MKTPYIIRLANAICILFLLVICYPQITIAQRSGHVIGGGYRHPLGYFAVTLSTDAILLSVGNQQYYYDSGVYYLDYGSGYEVVPPPTGVVVPYLPKGYETVAVGDADYYYYGGAFYINQGSSFRVIPAPVGAVVTDVPEGAREQSVKGVHYLLYNYTYYKPITQNGRDAYEMVQVN